jgi:hypothetical protein
LQRSSASWKNTLIILPLNVPEVLLLGALLNLGWGGQGGYHVWSTRTSLNPFSPT